MTEETAKLVAAMREVLRDRQDVHLALLFGSQARGKARPDSDVDVAVLVRIWTSSISMAT